MKVGRSAGKVSLVFGILFLGIIFAFGADVLVDKAVAGNNAGAAFSIWPDTGQTKCYDNSGEIPCPAPGEPFFGQDAQYQGPQRSYTKLGYGGVELSDTATLADGWIMTRDNVTGLIWEIKTDDGTIHDKDDEYTWCDTNFSSNGDHKGTCGDGTDTEDFINALNSSNFGGYSDWRLPTVKELSTLVNSSIPYPGPSIDTAYFPNTMSSGYWSAIAPLYRDNGAWVIYFDGGASLSVFTSYTYNVRAVRSGHDNFLTHLVDNHDGTVTDMVTGLMWQKCSMGRVYNSVTNGCDGLAIKSTWQQALQECEGLELAGYTDWRLPNRNELRSIVDYSIYDPAIDTTYFPNTVSSGYWSSTTYTYNMSIAWIMDFSGGVDTAINKYENIAGYDGYVRAVRSGQVRLVEHWNDNQNGVSEGLVDNHDGTITDTRTGLMWQKCVMGERYDRMSNKCVGQERMYTWSRAKTLCENFTLAGYNDWYLPSLDELETLIIENRDPSIDTRYFSNPQFFPSYWSSTEALGNAFAWIIRYDQPVFEIYITKIDGAFVRAARVARGTPSIPAPTGHHIFSYAHISSPIVANNIEQCRPLAVTWANGFLTLELKLPRFAQPVDVYMGIYMPGINPDDIFLFLDGIPSVAPLSEGVKPYMINSMGNVDRVLDMLVSASDLAMSDFYFYLLISPARDRSFENYYFWETKFGRP